MQIPIYLGAGILFQIPNLEFGINLGTGVGVLLEEIPDLQFVLNGVAELLQQIADLQFVVNLATSPARVVSSRECLKFWRKLQICKFRQILATSPTSPTTPHGRKGGLREYARQIGRGEKQIREWIKAGEVGKNCGNISAVFDRTYHLAAIHAAPRRLCRKLRQLAQFYN